MALLVGQCLAGTGGQFLLVANTLSPGNPSPPVGVVLRANDKFRHELDARAVVRSRPLLGGMHHENSLAHDGLA
jgi:hypothetical protein